MLPRQKVFNIVGPCIPQMHYMVDISGKVDEIISNYVDKGEYLTINRARQYGKTTTLELLHDKLSARYIVLNMNFEGKEDYFASYEAFAEGFSLDIAECLRREGVLLASIFDAEIRAKLPLRELSNRITRLCAESDKRIVLLIDEVDRAADNAVFLAFLGLLREKYIDLRTGKGATFFSVVLSGVHDIKNLKFMLRPEEKHSYNSPWNIAARFDVDMSFSTLEIESMLYDYERDYCTGMNIKVIAEQIYYYTRGYPFLVSDICKVICDFKLEWSVEGVNTAVSIIVKQNNTLFDDVTKNLINNPTFNNLVRRILLQGAIITFEEQNPDIDMGLMYGIFSRDDSGFVKVSNIIFETRIYNYYISIEATSGSFDDIASEKSLYIRDNHLDMKAVLNRFAQLMYAEYRDESSGFLEKHAGLLFLCYLKPIINGAGHYVVEPETRGGRRMDIVVFYGNEEHIIEVKIWRGERYEMKGVEQLARYIKYRGQKRGYLLSFCDNLKSPREGMVFTHDGCEITEVIIAYRDKV